MKRSLIALLLVAVISFPSVGYSKTPVVLEHLGGDIKYTFAGWPVLLMIGGGIAAIQFTEIDHKIANTNKYYFGNKTDNIANIIGSPYVIDTSSLALFTAGIISKNEEIKRTGEVLVEALVFTESTVLAMKGAFRRTRPNGGHYSFPSGHAARTFAVASALETMHGPAVGIPAFAVASFISFTRIDGNSHYLSDVVFGAAWGAAFGWGVARYHDHLAGKKLAILPVVGEFSGLQVTGMF